MRKNHENARIRCSRGSQRALSVRISLSFAVTLGATTIGCSGEDISEAGKSNDAAEDALIESHLTARGYDTSSLRFEGDKVRVEGDMEMSRAVLLSEAEAEAAGVVEKGYFLNTGPFGQGLAFNGKRIQLSFAAGVSSAWQTALNAAKAEWNSKTPRFAHDPGPAGTITVKVQALKNTNGTPDTITIAAGTIPPGQTITLNSNFSVGCGGSLEGMSANFKTHTALHEMGHVLGFAHPPPNPSSSRSQIPGTAVSSGNHVFADYQTIMEQGCNNLTTLTPDDVLSAQKKYPDCRTTCENNCTISVDPAQIGPCQAACPAQCGV